ncbi:response regulator [Parapedobacter sp. DT-150]|uniref:response regulator n=1 Tax=Parapedobacter sp. DT-150 TaxID=3396162 RepID=UPI003F1A53B1
MKKKVVVVEDNPSIRELIEYILEDNEIEVISFETATTFLEAVAAIRPDLYILDIMLPDGNGLDLCRHLKSNDATRQTPIVMMSAHYDQLDDSDACKPVDFIAKPFDIDNFVFRIGQQIA